LEPIQTLWINPFDSVFLTMPLMMEPKEKRLLNMPPRDPKAKLPNNLFFTRVSLVSLVTAGTAFSIYWVFGHYSVTNEDVLINRARTAAFIAPSWCTSATC
jgi:magnesium-transporting ATPase (P-type)